MHHIHLVKVSVRYHKHALLFQYKLVYSLCKLYQIFLRLSTNFLLLIFFLKMDSLKLNISSFLAFLITELKHLLTSSIFNSFYCTLNSYCPFLCLFIIICNKSICLYEYQYLNLPWIFFHSLLFLHSTFWLHVFEKPK